MKYIIKLILLAFCISLSSQVLAQKPILLGKITKQQLMEDPYKEWFESEYNSYNPDLSELKDIYRNDFSFTLFVGTWCGDTQRELPRMLKILESLGLPDSKIEIIGLNREKELIKQSPTKEHVGKNIFKIPTFIVLKNGKEAGRIVEYPVYSLEIDLKSILLGKGYSSNYRSYPLIIDWLDRGLLANENVSFEGLAEQIRFKTKNAGELVAVINVLSSQNKIKEAARLSHIAYHHFPESDHYKTYAQIFVANGENSDAKYMIHKALSKVTELDKINQIMDLYDQFQQIK